jgi:uncharacterized protein YycO
MAISVKRFPKQTVMKYQDARKKMVSGDILLCSGSGWFSKMIQKGTKSVWSHVGFVMRLDNIDRVMVLESVEPLGVRTVPLSKYLTDYDSKKNPYPGGLVIARHEDFAKKATEAKLKKFGQFAVDLFGYPYDKDEIAKIAVRISTSFLPFTASEKKALKPDREYICSEYAWECYRSVGIKIEHDKRGFIAPADFAKSKEVKLQAVLRQK